MIADLLPKSRAEAKARGCVRYDTGKPCRNGHIAERTTGNGQCCECAKGFRKKSGKTWQITYQAKNRDRYLELKRERGKRYRANNPKANYLTVKRWRESNWDAALAQCHKRRAVLRNCEGSFTKADIEEIRRLQRGRCAYCKIKGPLTIDHIVALACGGSNCRSNLQLLCKSCNSSKRHSDPIDFARREGRLL